LVLPVRQILTHNCRLCRGKHCARRARLERRPWLLPRPCRGRAQAQGRRDGQRATQGRALQVDQHGSRQHQERDRRHVSLIRPAAHRALSRGLRVALQSPFRSRQKRRASRPRRRANSACALPIDRGGSFLRGDIGVIRKVISARTGSRNDTTSMAAHGSMASSRPANSPTEAGAVAGLPMTFRRRQLD
jgi:hypothetical protein